MKTSPGTLELTTVDMHTAGEPVRIVTGGYPQLLGATLLDKRRDALAHHDRLRKLLMLEPRGHAEMYGVIPCPPDAPGAALAVLFMHNSGYSTMCGHATIALGRWMVDSGLVAARAPETIFSLQCPCGPVTLRVEVEGGVAGRVSFISVPAFVEAFDVPVDRGGGQQALVDIAYGGAYYAIVPASRLGLDLATSPLGQLIDSATQVTEQLRERLVLKHPDHPDLGFLYGTILTDEAAPGQPSCNICVFGDGQVDRSPTGSGVTARMALGHARGLQSSGLTQRFIGASGGAFTGRLEACVARAGKPAVLVEVSGRASYMGMQRFIIEPDDSLPAGLLMHPGQPVAAFGSGR